MMSQKEQMQVLKARIKILEKLFLAEAIKCLSLTEQLENKK